MITEEERRQRDLYNARTRKNRYEQDREERETLKWKNDEKISRLKIVREELEAQKKIAKSRYTGLEKYTEEKLRCEDWTGKKKDNAVNVYESTIVPEYEDYVNRIDDVLDAVCDEITRLQNYNMQLSGDILRLGSLINSLINEIRKLCN